MSIKAKMPGVVEEITIKVGDAVSAGQQLGTIEAMKMSMPLLADTDGTVKSVKAVGDRINPGDIIIEIE